MAVAARPLTPARAFHPTRRVDGRLLAGAAVFALSMLGLVLGLSVVLPENQTVLQATRDLPEGAIVQPDDITVARVRLPENMVQAALGADAMDHVVGQRLSSPVVAGQLLAPSQFGTLRAPLAPGRVELSIPVDPYTASGGQLAPGDVVIVLATPKQAPPGTPATVLVDQAAVVAVGRADQGLTVSSGSGASSGAASAGRPAWVTLDLDQEQAQRVSAAARTDYLDLGVVAPTAGAAQ